MPRTTYRPYFVYRQLTALGRDDARRDNPLPADDVLWAHAAALAPDTPDRYSAGRPDPLELADLRAAYDDGRLPHRIDLPRLAALIRDRGVDAVVRTVGGGYAELYAGDRYLDATGGLRHTLQIGPGLCHDNQIYAPRADFFICPAESDPHDAQATDDGRTVRADPDRFQTLAELADAAVVLAVAEAHRHRLIESRLHAAVQAGWDAFCSAVRQSLPEITDASTAAAGTNRAADHHRTRRQLLHHVRDLLRGSGPLAPGPSADRPRS